MVGAVPGRPVAVPVEPLVARQEPLQGREQVRVGAGADLDDDDPGRGVRDEDGQQAVRLGGEEGGARAGQVRQPRTVPGPDGELLGPYGKMLRRASRRRPIPPLPGADS